MFSPRSLSSCLILFWDTNTTITRACQRPREKARGTTYLERKQVRVVRCRCERTHALCELIEIVLSVRDQRIVPLAHEVGSSGRHVPCYDPRDQLSARYAPRGHPGVQSGLCADSRTVIDDTARGNVGLDVPKEGLSGRLI